MADYAAVLGKLAELGKGLLTYFSSAERRARRQLARDDRVRKAVQLEEQHYDRLFKFIDWVTPRIKLSKQEMKAWKLWKIKFTQDKTKFFKLT